MRTSNSDPQRIRILARRLIAEQPSIPRSAAIRAAKDLAAQTLTGDDDTDVRLIMEHLEGASSPRPAATADAWLDPRMWAPDPPLVALELSCDAADNLVESWILPVPEAALLAANWALRLAVNPRHDDLTGQLTVDGPLHLWEGRVRFEPAPSGSVASAWAWNLDPHSVADGHDLRTSFSGIGSTLRRRLARKSGPLLQPIWGRRLDVLPLPEDRDPAAPEDDRVGVAITVGIDGDTWSHGFDDLMMGVRTVGECIASAFGGPGSGRDEIDFGPPVAGEVAFGWYTFHSAPFEEFVEADDEL